MEKKLKKSAVKTALKPNDKTTAKSTPTVASAPVAVPAAKAPTPAPVVKAPSKPAVATIDVKLDVGLGNTVYLRGQGPGLTWEHGVPLVCVDAKTWRWSAEVKAPVTFKLLINDQIWSAGNDLTIAPGQKLEVAPEFV